MKNDEYKFTDTDEPINTTMLREIFDRMGEMHKHLSSIKRILEFFLVIALISIAFSACSALGIL